MVTPNPFLGVGMHSVGAIFAANCYAPQRFIKRWSWEIFWISQALWCWLLWPIIGAAVTIPQLGQVLAEAWQTPVCRRAMAWSFLFSLCYGVGGIAFNLSIRYIGFALTYAIAVGLSSVLGTLIPPLVKGHLVGLLQQTGAGWVVAGLAIGTLGIAGCGLAGRFKEQDLDAGQGASGGFDLKRGLLMSLLAGVLSAMYGFAIEAAAPVTALAERYGADVWQGNVAYLTANPGAFLTSLLYCGWLIRRNQSGGQFVRLEPGDGGGRLGRNYLFAWLCGTLWYGQFFFYNLGHVRMGRYQFTSWGIHMIMLVLFSNVTGLLFAEWKGTRARTRGVIVSSLAVLVLAVLALAYGNYLGQAAATLEATP